MYFVGHSYMYIHVCIFIISIICHIPNLHHRTQHTHTCIFVKKYNACTFFIASSYNCRNVKTISALKSPLIILNPWFSSKSQATLVHGVILVVCCALAWKVIERWAQVKEANFSCFTHTYHWDALKNAMGNFQWQTTVWTSIRWVSFAVDLWQMNT